ncbi:MAG: hypothetical protein GXO18_08370 [Aquificae bacterium]|nr:hypothetical protein [Aquificota bacterium]
MLKKTDIYKMSEYVEIVSEFQPACWEEADFADECRPVDFKNLNGENRKKEDYYVDFSDLVVK